MTYLPTYLLTCILSSATRTKKSVMFPHLFLDIFSVSYSLIFLNSDLCQIFRWLLRLVVPPQYAIPGTNFPFFTVLSQSLQKTLFLFGPSTLFPLKTKYSHTTLLLPLTTKLASNASFVSLGPAMAWSSYSWTTSVSLLSASPESDMVRN